MAEVSVSKDNLSKIKITNSGLFCGFLVENQGPCDIHAQKDFEAQNEGGVSFEARIVEAMGKAWSGHVLCGSFLPEHLV